MNVQVFDTHVKTTNGHYLHFDVLVTPEHAGKAKLYAQGITSEITGLLSGSVFINSEIKEQPDESGHSCMRFT